MAKLVHRADFRSLALPILLFPCLCAGIAYFYSLNLIPSYASKVVIGTPEESSSWSTHRFLTDVDMIKSGRVLIPAIKKLQERNSRIFQDASGNQFPEAKALELFRNKLLHIQPFRGTSLIGITATAEDPKEARMAATAVAESYADFYAAQMQEFQKSGLENAPAEVNKLKTEIKTTDALIAKQKKKPKSTAAAKEWTATREKLELQKKNYSLQLASLEARMRGEKGASAEVRIVQKAEVSDFPVQTDISGNLLIGIFGGLIIGICFSLFKVRSGRSSRESDLIPAASQ